MSFVDMVITRRHFEARYNQVGRCMLADLAEIFGVGFDQAELWADEIDRATTEQIAAACRPLSGGGQTAGAECAAQRSAPASFEHQ
ncbi:hypothetical protein FIV32_02265 [Sphingomonadales bacterium 58]|uniref:hypothetical protein n=1 Tax=Sphingobium sp. S8 TaxID=2758385 RepID=UPI00191A965A|nr:hypothetical protein [Sphingobium sp. S8]MBY2957574.1 hypothetical protein [Sphingomonadales bacterium 58]CAD7335353.1 hypothetical protein SPHS8_00465 [Sphingobium sp. S8]